MKGKHLHFNDINIDEMTLAEIEKYLACNQVDALLLQKLYDDPRKGATQLAKRWNSNERARKKEKNRLSPT